MAYGFKTGGRAKGTPNKTTEAIRKKVDSFLADKIRDIDEVYSSLEPKEKLMFIAKLLDFSLPRLKAVELDAIKEESLGIDLSQLSTEELKERLRIVKLIEDSRNKGCK